MMAGRREKAGGAQCIQIRRLSGGRRRRHGWWGDCGGCWLELSEDLGVFRSGVSDAGGSPRGSGRGPGGRLRTRQGARSMARGNDDPAAASAHKDSLRTIRLDGRICLQSIIEKANRGGVIEG